jgi:hypothetical protein
LFRARVITLTLPQLFVFTSTPVPTGVFDVAHKSLQEIVGLTKQQRLNVSLSNCLLFNLCMANPHLLQSTPSAFNKTIVKSKETLHLQCLLGAQIPNI